MIRFNRLKDGKKHAVTLSYDDGDKADYRLVEIMNKYGIRGTFHLNSGFLSGGNKVSLDELNDLYKNHEISCHGVAHRSLNTLSETNIVQEILEDRRVLEQATGNFVRGLSYANGAYSDDIVSVLKACGIVYARTVQDTKNFSFPNDFMKWHPTCHHRDCLELGERFMNTMGGYLPYPRLLYVWGHSYEFNNNNNWELIENFCSMVGNNDEIWYATNIELYEYITAQKQLVISADNKLVYNPTSVKIWFTDNENEHSILPGEFLKL